MKKFRIVLWVLLVIILLAVGFIAWLCTGSFTYKSSMAKKTFVIEAPIDVVCERAKNINFEEESQDPLMPKIDMEEAARNFSIGQPIEVEIDHPVLGTITAGIKINLEINDDALIVHGRTVSIEPSQIKKFGKTIADIENVTFTLTLFAQDGNGKNLGGKEIGTLIFTKVISNSLQNVIPDPVKNFLPSFQKALKLKSDPNSGKTVFELTFDPEVKVCFREMGFTRSQVKQIVEGLQEEIIQKIEVFLDENLRKPGEDELARQNDEEENSPKSGNLWNLLNHGAPHETAQKSEVEEEPAEQDDETIDISGLDEEI